MLVFCEDCGAKHTIDENDVLDDTFQLRCDVCDFLITAKSLPQRTIVQKPIDPTMELTCSHDVLDFGLVKKGQSKTKTLILAAKDGRKVELTGALEPKIKDNVSITPVSGMVFRVEVVSTSNITGSCLSQYQGAGVVITDTISRLQKTVHLSFIRTE